MAVIKISAMTPATTLTGSELIPIVQGGFNKSVTPDLIKSYYAYFYPSVVAYANLPAASTHPSEIYIVLTSTGIWLINRKDAGMYYSNGVIWTRLGDIPTYFDSANFQLYDNVDNTKILKFGTSNIGNNTTVTLTVPNRSLIIDNITTSTTTTGTGFLKGNGTAISFDNSTYLTSLSGAVLVDQTTPQTVGDTTNRLLKLWATDVEVTNPIVGSTTLNLLNSGIGTTTTVLHGNAGGTLAFGPVVEADITLAAGSSSKNTQVGTHGFAPALSGVNTQFLRGDGAWAAPGAVTVPNAYAEESFAYSANTPHTITHNFGARPLVQCITSTGDQIIPLTINHTSVDAVAITFDDSATYDVILTLGSPPLTAYVSTSGNYSMLAGDTLIEVTAANKLVTLLTPVGRVGKQVTIKNSSTGVINIQTAAGLIEGVADVTVPSSNAYTFASNNTNWIAI
jgi:hypothetical protein